MDPVQAGSVSVVAAEVVAALAFPKESKRRGMYDE